MYNRKLPNSPAVHQMFSVLVPLPSDVTMYTIMCTVHGFL